MGRANIYLSDELERRVRAAKLPISEICQQALTAAVEAAEAAPCPARARAPRTASPRDGPRAAAGSATPATAELLRLLRDLALPEIPRDLLPDSWFSWNDDQTLAWEAGFVEAARSAVRGAARRRPPDPAPAGARDPGRAGRGRRERLRRRDGRDARRRGAESTTTSRAGRRPTATGRRTDAGRMPDRVTSRRSRIRATARRPPARVASTPARDDSGSYVGVDRDGRRVAFDPHAALAGREEPAVRRAGAGRPASPADPVDRPGRRRPRRRRRRRRPLRA